jgi:hypothetical protein
MINTLLLVIYILVLETSSKITNEEKPQRNFRYELLSAQERHIEEIEYEFCEKHSWEEDEVVRCNDNNPSTRDLVDVSYVFCWNGSNNFNGKMRPNGRTMVCRNEEIKPVEPVKKKINHYRR